MKRWTAALAAVSIFLAGDIILAQSRRAPLPQEVVNSVPGNISQVEDQGRIQVYLQEKRAALQEVIDVSQGSYCLDLLEERISALDFARLVDRADAKADQAIAVAFARLRDRLSSTGRTELDIDIAKSSGYALDITLEDHYLRNPDQMDRRWRWRCEVGFPSKVVEPESGIALGPNAEVPTNVPLGSGGPNLGPDAE